MSDTTSETDALKQRIKELEEALEPFAAIGRRQHWSEMGGAYQKAAEALPISPADRPSLDDAIGSLGSG